MGIEKQVLIRVGTRLLRHCGRVLLRENGLSVINLNRPTIYLEGLMQGTVVSRVKLSGFGADCTPQDLEDSLDYQATDRGHYGCQRWHT